VVSHERTVGRSHRRSCFAKRRNPAFVPARYNKTDEGRQANRRVEIQISANEKLQQQDAQHQQQGQQAAATPARP
jgi:hypothetical protein